MKKVAIISDIHANFEALEAVMSDIQSQGIHSIWSLGDIVGYGADPSACLDLLRDSPLVEHIILGNHDEDSSASSVPIGYNETAKISLEWTSAQLSGEQKDYLWDLRRMIPLDNWNIALVHSSLNEPSKWHYIKDRYQAGAHFQEQHHALCFCGHTHRPKVFHKKKVVKEIKITTESHLFSPELDEEGGAIERLLVNVGSVGQPRDGDANACYVVLEITENEQANSLNYTISHRRVVYDIRTAAQKITAAGLPQKLADRLILGM